MKLVHGISCRMVIVHYSTQRCLLRPGMIQYLFNYGPLLGEPSRLSQHTVLHMGGSYLGGPPCSLSCLRAMLLKCVGPTCDKESTRVSSQFVAGGFGGLVKVNFLFLPSAITIKSTSEILHPSPQAHHLLSFTCTT